MTTTDHDISHRVNTSLPPWPRVVVIVAHPDDESFGLGAVIDAFVRSGAEVHVLCFTKGEASTLGAQADDLGEVRRQELADAGRALGVSGTTLLDFPDSALASVPQEVLVASAREVVSGHAPSGILAFEPSGITGHPDHQAATRAAIEIGSENGLPVLGWALPEAVAEGVNADLGTNLRGQPADQLDFALTCDRTTQFAAITAHASQAVPTSPLWRRLELLGNTEWLRWLTPDR